MNLARLPVSIIMMFAMMLGTYMLPQRATRALLKASMRSCVEQVPGESVLESNAPASEQHKDCGCSPLLSGLTDEEHGLDEVLLSHAEILLSSQGSDRIPFVLPALSSHVTDLSRRPPRSSIA